MSHSLFLKNVRPWAAASTNMLIEKGTIAAIGANLSAAGWHDSRGRRRRAAAARPC